MSSKVLIISLLLVIILVKVF